jgi:hypothetical protein
MTADGAPGRQEWRETTGDKYLFQRYEAADSPTYAHVGQYHHSLWDPGLWACILASRGG